MQKSQPNKRFEPTAQKLRFLGSLRAARSGVGSSCTLAFMDSSSWDAVITALDSKNVDVAVEAAFRLHADSTEEDVPKLLGLLQTGRDFFVREAAAWPLAELAGPTVLRELFIAYQRGFDEGHDNDGFTAALLEIPALYPTEAKAALEQLVTSKAGAVREHAEWLMEFASDKT